MTGMGLEGLFNCREIVSLVRRRESVDLTKVKLAFKLKHIFERAIFRRT